MDDEKLQLFIIEKMEKAVERNANRSILRNTIIAIFVVPLAYFGITCLASKSAEQAAESRLSHIENTYKTVFSNLTNLAIDSAKKADDAKKDAEGAKANAEGAYLSAQAASQEMLKSSDEIASKLLSTEPVQIAISKAGKVKIGSCKDIEGNCGYPVSSKDSNMYFDRVSFSCPDDKPVLKSIRFGRCGDGNDGMRIIGKCCEITSQ